MQTSSVFSDILQYLIWHAVENLGHTEEADDRADVTVFSVTTNQLTGRVGYIRLSSIRSFKGSTSHAAIWLEGLSVHEEVRLLTSCLVQIILNEFMLHTSVTFWLRLFQKIIQRREKKYGCLCDWLCLFRNFQLCPLVMLASNQVQNWDPQETAESPLYLIQFDEISSCRPGSQRGNTLSACGSLSGLSHRHDTTDVF